MKKNGFTLLELLVVLSILFILASLAVPSMQHLIAKTRAESAIARIHNAYLYARSQAVLRGEVVTYCGSADGKQCDGRWSEGQITFVDKQATHQFNPGDHMLRVQPKLSGNATLQLRAFPSSRYLQLNPKGYNKQQNGTFIYSRADGADGLTKKLVISRSGRIRQDS